ncbi:hypothetical protein [Lewinella sp. LCG006]|uniref:hypothetical protein n=1 Tax=Lewinella sp. LCG006 TaxID=3231911 RepID=UPI003460AC34
MDISLQDYAHSLDFNKLSGIMTYHMYDYNDCERFKVLFESGSANGIVMYFGREDSFSGLIDFFMHVRSLRFANWDHYLNLSFLDKTYSLTSLEPSSSKEHIDACLEAFFGNIFPISKKAIGLIKAQANIQNYKTGFSYRDSGYNEIVFHVDDYFCIFSSFAIN